MANSVILPPAPATTVSANDSCGCFIEPLGDELIRRDLHGPEHLEAVARQLAEASALAPPGRRGVPLLQHFANTGRELKFAHRQIRLAFHGHENTGPETEWLLDNFHIIADSLREVREDLPQGYLQKLPKLAVGVLAGHPRVYALGLSLIAHTDSGLDEDQIFRFVQAYQSVTPLTTGELWAVPTMLRLGLLENLRRLARHILRAWEDRQGAAKLVETVTRTVEQHQRESAAPVPETIAWETFLRAHPSALHDPFVVRLLDLLRDHATLGKVGIDWLENQLRRQETNADQVFRRETQRQAGNQVCVGNCVTSLRLLSALDWNVFFEKVSPVDEVLRADPAGIYARQDFGTRDHYRRTVEKLARGCPVLEQDVARRAVELARRGAAPTALANGTPARATPLPRPAPETHVGHYLLGKGRAELTASIGYRPRFSDGLLNAVLTHPRWIYFGGIGIVGTAILALLLGAAAQWSVSVPLLVLVAFAALLPASELAIGLVNYLVTVLLPARVLPKLDFKDGIPADCATCVAMPTLLTSTDTAAELVDRLEVHYLANPDPRLCFALLTDFADAPTEHLPTDDVLVQAALDGIRRLNKEYCAVGPHRFFLFHRPRQWNASEGCWMGWERKRGKLQDFNRLLRGDKGARFSVRSGELPFPIRFVITLDMDTQLPRETAARLVGALAHPLNLARFDPAAGRVVEGYGILQPRVNILMQAAARSLFSRIYAVSAGIDPYTTAVSDVYQDLFGVGSFTGKGIYDVDAFEAAVGRRFAENSVLSHDLIEGNFARCGLVSDVQLLDDFPSRYHVFARRDHRWVRGDWQILPWVVGGRRGPTANDNPLPLLERWKILDNLRRSLIPTSLLLLFVAGWTVLPGSPWFWTVLAALVPLWPFVLLAVDHTRAFLRGRPLVASLRAWSADLPATLGQAGLALVFLVDQARLQVDAIGRTLFRLFVSRRRLLEWESAASTEQRLGAKVHYFYRTMWPTVLLTVVVGLLVAVVQPAALAAAAPLLLAWLLSPLVAFLVSRPWQNAEPGLSDIDRRDLRMLARRTWCFFEKFVGEEDHYLPPDNYQEDPDGKVAHRTSPTNIGLMIVSTLAAHDFGYLSTRRLLERLEKTFDTLAKLDRFNGHFHNWYNTLTLRSLEPVYISTVDSGNLLGCLLTLKQGLLEIREQPLWGDAVRDGLGDTLRLVAAGLGQLTTRGRHGTDPVEPAAKADNFKEVEADLTELQQLLGEKPANLLDGMKWLNRLETQTAGLRQLIKELAIPLQEQPDSLLHWVQCFAEQVRDRREELAEAAPWLDHLARLDLTAYPQIRAIQEELVAPAALTTLAAKQETWAATLAAVGAEAGQAPWTDVADAVRRSRARELLERCDRLIGRATSLAADMDFTMLYNAQRHLFAVGHNLTLGRLDNSHYDLLASEASLASFLAIARGEAPRRHWFQLGRPLTMVAGQTALISWGGTMFEYLMPHLLMTALPDTLLAESSRAAVGRQIEYGRQLGVPWGISESGFSALDAALDYQYQSFGVPGLGLRRGLGQDLVIAPYATLLALKVRPRSAARNLQRLAREHATGPYGFYEAVDYTPSRLPPNCRSVVVRSYMAHHQGMGLVALANQLLGGPMPRRFHAEPMVRATELLLQERVPRSAPIVEPAVVEAAVATAPQAAAPLSRRLTTPFTPHPRTHLLSNGQYTVMTTNAGGSWSYCRGLDVTRWREDCTRDAWGQFCYIKDLRNGKLWSAGHQPLGAPADLYEVIFSADKVEFHRIDGKIETHLEITVSPENNCEVRRVTLTNHDSRTHLLELTSYAEPVLAAHAADLAHQAFGKLFLETEYLPGPKAILCRRRPRSESEKPVWGAHILAVERETAGDVQFETDRSRFVGRGRSPANAAAFDSGANLSGTTGAVLDPVFSLRLRVSAPPGGSVSLAFTTALTDTREEALTLADKYHDLHGVTRAFEMAWAHCQIELQHHHLTTQDVHLFQRLAAHLIYSGPFLRAAPALLLSNSQGQPGLWRHGISGDKPLVVLHVKESEELLLVRQLLAAHSYWRLKGLEVDLLILNKYGSGYFEELQQQLLNLVRTSASSTLLDKPGGVFVRKADQISQEDQTLLEVAARVVLFASQGDLPTVLELRERAFQPTAEPSFKKRSAAAFRKDARGPVPRNAALPRPTGEKLLFANGYGGFTVDGKEYVIAPTVTAGRAAETPAPWINVVANENGGFLVSERGSGYTWAGNSQANRLTPWNNDPVCDPPGEAVYVRDEITGEVWTVPARSGAECRHGQGYTVFTQSSNGVDSELLLTMPPEDSVKLLRVTLRNTGKQMRRLSVTFYAEWVLGTVRDNAPMHVLCELDPQTEALLARNPFNADFAGRVAFADVNLRPRTVTADRTDFLGRNGAVTTPAALMQPGGLSGRVEVGRDPCAALQVAVDLPPGQQKEIVFLLGQAADVAEVRRLTARYRAAGQVAATLAEVQRFWDRILTAVQVRTPNAALDLMLNRWLLYQVFSCRMLARSAFYQSGGAYGFRDQLQDSMALVYAAPGETRRHILRAAARQFVEGDVQHWWHPPSGRGVRTRFSDDFLWLPLVVAHYVAVTDDRGLLDEKVPFIEGPQLKPEQEEDYGQPQISGQMGTVYEHCVRAIENGLRFGANGLPLMGTGDWNDGMNRVGSGGKGETVWGGWFLLTILGHWASVAEQRGDGDRAGRYRQEGERLRNALEENAWDGRWYRRAYFDDGSPLGSAANEECKIDSIAQTWAVISGQADEHRAREAMSWVERMLVKEQEHLILLFTPPFDKGPQQPGYVRGYVPGIRENGGQYTHAATWVVQATALLGDGGRALALYDMLNPILHTQKMADVEQYRVEPYVAVADVYGEAPHAGRGGWTWYTGTAGWLYRVALETILGFRVEGNRLRLDPCVGPSFSPYEIVYRYRTTTYHIRVENSSGVQRGVKSVELDGSEQEGNTIGLVDDGGRHHVRVVMG